MEQKNQSESVGLRTLVFPILSESIQIGLEWFGFSY